MISPVEPSILVTRAARPRLRAREILPSPPLAKIDDALKSPGAVVGASVP